MNPKKAKDLIPGYAKKQDIPEEHIKDMISGYYKEIRENLSGLVHISIDIPGLGALNATYKKLQKERDNIEKMPFKMFPTEQDQLERVKKLIEWKEAEYRREDEVTEQKRAFRKKKRDEHPGNNSAGVEQQGTDN